MNQSISTATVALKKSDDLEDVATLLDLRVRSGVLEAMEWSLEAEEAEDYMESRQWADMTADEVDEVIPIVVNTMRRPVDNIKAQILDGEMLVNPKGRRSKFYDQGKLLVDTMRWTRDEERTFKEQMEQVITGAVHQGFAPLHEFYDWDAGGKDKDGRPLGMPRARAIPAQFLVWDAAATDWQARDAEWIISFEPRKVSYLQEYWAEELKAAGMTEVRPDLGDFFFPEEAQRLALDYGIHGTDNARRQSRQSTYDWRTMDPMAYEFRQWEKRVKWETRYLLLQQTPTREIGEEEYARLDKADKKYVHLWKSPKVELWETVKINEKVIRRSLAPEDESLNGHGEYPIAFFHYVRVKGRTKGKGEPAFIKGMQDLENRTFSRLLDQLDLASLAILTGPDGGISNDDKEKLINRERKPGDYIPTLPGYSPLGVVAVNPTGANLLTAAFQLMERVGQGVHGIRDVNNGVMPYQTSGKGIRALQSAADLLSVIPKRHIESGLFQSCILRLGNILQNMSGSRMIEVSDAGRHGKSDDKQTIYVGRSMLEIQREFNLLPAVDPRTGQPLVKPNSDPEAEQEPLALMDMSGQLVQTLVLGDGTNNLDWRHIELELDTGKQRDREARGQFALEVMGVLGRGAARWALGLAGVPNEEQLWEDMQEAGMADQIQGMAEQLGKENDMDAGQVLELFLQQMQQIIQQQKAGQGAPPPGQTGPPGAPAPAGGPPVAPGPGQAVGAAEAPVGSAPAPAAV